MRTVEEFQPWVSADGAREGNSAGDMKVTDGPGHEIYQCEPDARPACVSTWNAELRSATGQAWK